MSLRSVWGLVQIITGSPPVSSSLYPYTFQPSGAPFSWASVFPAWFTTTTQLCDWRLPLGQSNRGKRGKSPTKTPLPHTHILGTARALSLGSSEGWALLPESELLRYHTTLEAHTWGVAEREEGENGKPFPHVATASTAHHPELTLQRPQVFVLCFVQRIWLRSAGHRQ